MQIPQISPTDVTQSVREQVPTAGQVDAIDPQKRDREPWNETLFVRYYNEFANQLGRRNFEGGSDKLSELAFVYESSHVPTVEGFAANMVSSSRF